MGKKKSNSSADDLSSAIADGLNSKFKGLKVAYNLDGDVDSPNDVNEWVSSGCAILDLMVSNRPKAGTFPVGRISEVTGLEQSGKSLLAAHALVDTQRKGGLGVLIDTENAVSNEFLEAIGVDLSKLLYIGMECLEDIYEAVENIIEKASGSDRLVTIIIDSVAGATTKMESAEDFDRGGWATGKSIINSKAMRKITQLIGRERICLILTNQLRQNLNAMGFGDPYTTSGGKAIPFHTSVRLRLKRTGNIKMKVHGKEIVVGAKTSCETSKNRMGPPKRKIEYDIYYDSGIDDYGAWVRVMKDYKIVAAGGAWMTYKLTDDSGEVIEEIKFQAKDLPTKLEERPDIKEAMYNDICDKMILKYKSHQENPEDLIIDNDLEYMDKEDLQKEDAKKAAKKAAKAEEKKNKDGIELPE